MQIGFTGTHKGMTEAQKVTVRNLLLIQKEESTKLLGVLHRDEFHHGDCIGADAQANDIAWEVGYDITIHPPTIIKNRFFCKAGPPPKGISSIGILQKFVVLPEKAYFVRDKDIVNAAERIIATPAGFQEELRSGTWTTIRYARKKKIQITIVWPDGSIKEENF